MCQYVRSTYASVHISQPSLPCYFERNSDVGRRRERRLGVPWRAVSTPTWTFFRARCHDRCQIVRFVIGLGQRGTHALHTVIHCKKYLQVDARQIKEAFHRGTDLDRENFDLKFELDFELRGSRHCFISLIRVSRNVCLGYIVTYISWILIVERLIFTIKIILCNLGSRMMC